INTFVGLLHALLCGYDNGVENRVNMEDIVDREPRGMASVGDHGSPVAPMDYLDERPELRVQPPVRMEVGQQLPGVIARQPGGCADPLADLCCRARRRPTRPDRPPDSLLELIFADAQSFGPAFATRLVG